MSCTFPTYYLNKGDNITLNRACKRPVAQVLLAALLLAAAALVVAQADPKPSIAKGAAEGATDADKPAARVSPAAGAEPAGTIGQQEDQAGPDGDPEAPAGSKNNLVEVATGQPKAAAAAGNTSGGDVVATPKQLEQAVQEAAALQLLGKRKKVVNGLIKQAAPAELTGGHGDVSVTGARKPAFGSAALALKCDFPGPHGCFAVWDGLVGCSSSCSLV